MTGDFNRQRLAAMDRLRRDGRLTPSARLVGLEIYARVNRTSIDAWPAESTIATDVHIDIKTVKRAISALEKYGYFEIVRKRGVSNRYRPTFEGRTGAENVPSPASELAVKIPASGDKKGLSDGGKSGPQFPSRNPFRTASTALAPQPATLHVSSQQGTFEHSEDLRERPGDERVEAEVIRQFGDDGPDVLGRLHEIDSGRPRLRLIQAARDGKLSREDLDAARYVAMREGRPDKQPPLHGTTTTSTKGGVGATLAAAGAVQEAVAVLQAFDGLNGDSLWSEGTVK